MSDEIQVKVTKHGRRRYLIMYYDDPVTGDREQRSTKKTNRRDAEREAAKWEAELREGRYRRNVRMTWEQFRTRYEDEKLASLSTHSQKGTATAFNHFEAIINPQYLRSVNSEAVSRFQAELRAKGFPDTSISAYLRALRAALNWAVKQKLLAEPPEFDMPQQAKGQRMMRGRPVTGEEFERMIATVPKVRRRDADAWTHYLEGLWLSGLRLEESTIVSWDQDEPFAIVLSGRHPMFRILAEAQKARRDELLPMTPDFAAFILKTPEDQRQGRLFKLPATYTGEPMHPEKVGAVVSAIGKKAGVVVNKAEGKFASAHDLRRAFGTRWASRVKPLVLQRLMRHKNIETTQKYYVDLDADDIADELWEKHAAVGTSVGTSQNPPSREKETEMPDNKETRCEATG